MSQYTQIEKYKSKNLVTLGLELILPHHAFYRLCGLVIVFGVVFCVIHRLNVTFHCEINELANWHPGINLNWLCTGNFQGPGITEPNVTFASCCVNINP